MSSLTRSRVLNVGALSLALLLIGFLVREFVISRPAVLGEWKVPALRGWQRKTRQGNASSAVEFHKNVGNEELFIKLTWHIKDSQNPPKTVQDLQKIDVETQAHLATMISQTASLLRTNPLVIQRISTQPTSLHGMPALLIKNFSPGRKPTQMQMLLFTSGRNYYDLLANHRMPQGETSSPQAKAQLDGAWQTLSGALISK